MLTLMVGLLATAGALAGTTAVLTVRAEAERRSGGWRYGQTVAHQDYLFSEGIRREHTVRVRVETSELRDLDRIASREFGGNRSAALRALMSEAIERRRVVSGR